MSLVRFKNAVWFRYYTDTDIITATVDDMTLTSLTATTTASK